MTPAQRKRAQKKANRREAEVTRQTARAIEEANRLDAACRDIETV